MPALSEEHGRLKTLAGPCTDLHPGDLLEFIPGHGCTTVNPPRPPLRAARRSIGGNLGNRWPRQSPLTTQEAAVVHRLFLATADSQLRLRDRYCISTLRRSCSPIHG